jgi:hypothetical protein
LVEETESLTRLLPPELLARAGPDEPPR